MLLTKKIVDQFVLRFEYITDQELCHWSDYEELKSNGLEDVPFDLGRCLDSCISSEINRVVEGCMFSAPYVRDLAQLLVDLRQAMV